MTALITGATRGIGREIALLFKEKGYTVFGLYAQSESDAKEMRADGINMLKCDVSSREQIEGIREITGTPTVIVNNAGIALREVFQNVSCEDEARLYGVNLFGALNVTRVFLPGMINAKRGSIINISSVFGETGGSMEVDYSTSKAALIGFTKALAREVGPSCIRVNCITPGIIDTDMNANLSIDDVRSITDEIPLETLGRPRDIANAAFFLASDDAKYITGAVLRVDGGWQ